MKRSRIVHVPVTFSVTDSEGDNRSDQIADDRSFKSLLIDFFFFFFFFRNEWKTMDA